MPLLDHFQSPLFPSRSWASFHGFGITHMAGNFNMRPNRYGFLAESNVPIGITTITADVAAFEEDTPTAERSNGAVAAVTEVGAPPQPPLVMPVDFSSLGTFEVRTYDQERARTLMAVVEWVSPGNKDRPEGRHALLDKCGDETAMQTVAFDLYAVAYRVHVVGQRTQLEAWPAALTLGTPLPTMLLWLTESLCVPLALEAGYQAAGRHAAIG